MGFYLGLLPMAKGMGSIRNRQSQGPFKTSGTEMWPAKMCQWISSMYFRPGHPLLRQLRPREFHDGGGLCSPGRWPPIEETWRIATVGLGYATRRAGSVDELAREVFRMAAGGEEGCRLVRDQHFIKELVDTMGSWIKAQDLAVPGLIDIAEGQPLRLKLIRAILQAADDPDRDFLLHERHLDFAKAKFDEEIEEGLMEKMSPETFRERFGENTAIAALAVIVEDEEKLSG